MDACRVASPLSPDDALAPSSPELEWIIATQEEKQNGRRQRAEQSHPQLAAEPGGDERLLSSLQTAAPTNATSVTILPILVTTGRRVDRCGHLRRLASGGAAVRSSVGPAAHSPAVTALQGCCVWECLNLAGLNFVSHPVVNSLYVLKIIPLPAIALQS